MLVVPVTVSDVPGFIELPLEKVRVTVGVVVTAVVVAAVVDADVAIEDPSFEVILPVMVFGIPVCSSV